MLFTHGGSLIDGTAPAQTPACMHGVCSSRVRPPFKCGKSTRQVTTELRTLHGASHPHVVKYHQAFFDNGAITIVMEHMDGGSLADVLKLHNGLKEPYIAELARQVRLLRWSRSRRLGLLKQTAFALRRPGVMNLTVSILCADTMAAIIFTFFVFLLSFPQLDFMRCPLFPLCRSCLDSCISIRTCASSIETSNPATCSSTAGASSRYPVSYTHLTLPTSDLV